MKVEQQIVENIEIAYCSSVSTMKINKERRGLVKDERNLTMLTLLYSSFEPLNGSEKQDLHGLVLRVGAQGLCQDNERLNITCYSNQSQEDRQPQISESRLTGVQPTHLHCQEAPLTLMGELYSWHTVNLAWDLAHCCPDCHLSWRRLSAIISTSQS